MDSDTGFWQSIAAPRLEEKVPRNTWMTFPGMQSKRPESGGNEGNNSDQSEAPQRIPDMEYPHRVTVGGN